MASLFLCNFLILQGGYKMSQQLIVSIGAELSGFDRAMKSVQSSVSDIGNKMKGINGESFKKVGAAVTDVGKKMTLLTAPIAAVGLASLKIGTDFESSMSAVSAVTGATGADLDALKEQARELGATTVFSATEASGAMEMLGRAGFSTEEIMSSMPGLLDLAASSAVDLGSAADITSNILSGFAMDASEAGKVADILAMASANANTDVEGLGEAFKYVGPVAQGLGVSIEDTAAAIGLLGDAGVAGGQAGNMLKTGLLNLASPSKQASDLMKELGINVFDAEGNMKDLPSVIGELENGLDGMTSQQKAASLEMLFGKEAVSGFMALIEAGPEELAKFSSELENSEGTAKSMADTMSDNLAGKIKEMMSALQELALVVFDNLEPAFRAIVEKATEAVQWFGQLSPGVQTAIIAFGAVAVAIGPILMIAGTLISSIGSIITVVGTLGTALTAAGGFAGIFGTALTVLTGPIGLAVAAIALLGIGVVAAVKHFSKDAIEPVTRFGDEVSESTQKAVGAFMDMSEQADVALKEVAWSQQEMTQEMATNMIEGQQQITDTLLAAIDERHNAEIEATQAQFEHLDGLSEEQKERIIESTNQRFDAERAATETGNAQINEIIQKAAEEKRALTQEESDTILQIREGMTEQAVKVMSDNEVEQKAILEKMKDNASTISALEAAEVVKNSVKKKDDVIKEANDQYDETYKWAIRQRDELGTISEDEAKEIIDAAKKKRDESVKNAEDMHEKVVKEAKSQAKEHVNEVDWETGEIKSKWEVFKSNISDKAKELGSNVKNWFKDLWTGTKEYFTGLWNDTKTIFTNIGTAIKEKVTDAKTAASNKITEMKTAFVNKFTEIVTSAGTKFNEAKEKITKPIEQAKETVSKAVEAVKGFFSNMKLTFPKITMPKLPKFTLTGSFSLMPPSVPKVGIEWFAKGGIMNNPTAFGMNGNNLMVGGEAGAEAILPLNKKNLGGIGKGVAATMNIPSTKSETVTVNEGDQVFNFTFNIDKMTGDEKDAKKLTDMMSKRLIDDMKRIRGVRG